MSRIIIQNATILALDDEDTFFYPGYLEIRNDKIFGLGPWSPDTSLGEFRGETIIICGKDKLVMPGLVDLHFHTSVAKVRLIFSSHKQENDTNNLFRATATTCLSGNTSTQSGTPQSAPSHQPPPAPQPYILTPQPSSPAPQP